MRARPLLVTAASLAVVSGVVLQSSTAAMTAATDTTGAWATGTISLTDDDGGASSSALFNESGLSNGSKGAKCIAVSYTGSASAQVKLFAGLTGPDSGGLASQLNLTITRVASGDASCSNPDVAPGQGAVTVFASNSLSHLVSTHSAYASGAGEVTMTSSQTHTYRFRWALPAENVPQGQSVSATFTWEARTA